MARVGLIIALKGVVVVRDSFLKLAKNVFGFRTGFTLTPRAKGGGGVKNHGLEFMLAYSLAGKKTKTSIIQK